MSDADAAGRPDPDEVFRRARAALEAEHDQLAGQLGELEPETSDLAFDDNFADSGQVAAEQGEHKVLASRLRDQLADVEGALARLDDGTYGHCQACGEPIEPARLEAMPATRFCIQHAG
ncbi:MAG: TraR/DksA C4-type zinc finger protein [Acidimicrobiales bacterium]